MNDASIFFTLYGNTVQVEVLTLLALRFAQIFITLIIIGFFIFMYHKFMLISLYCTLRFCTHQLNLAKFSYFDGRMVKVCTIVLITKNWLLTV